MGRGAGSGGRVYHTEVSFKKTDCKDFFHSYSCLRNFQGHFFFCTCITQEYFFPVFVRLSVLEWESSLLPSPTDILLPSLFNIGKLENCGEVRKYQ